MPEVFLEHFHQFWTWRLSHHPTALSLMCLSLIFKRLSVLFFGSHSFTLCPLSMSCTSDMLEQSSAESLNLKLTNTRLGRKGACGFFRSFLHISSVSLSRSVHLSLFLFLSFPKRLSLLLFCFFLLDCFVHIFTPSWLCLSFYLIFQFLWPEGKTCKGIGNTHSQSTWCI